MELIPIIYTTLKIFAAIAVVTIVGSYISYKIRKKKGLLYEDEATDILETPDIIKERAQQNQNLNNESKPKEERREKRSSSSREKSERSIREERERKKARDRKRDEERYQEEKRRKEERRKQEEKDRIKTKERIQVLNTLDNQKSNSPKSASTESSEFSKPKVNPNKYKTLGDDIMKNYAESKDDEFKPLKTKNKND